MSTYKADSLLQTLLANDGELGQLVKSFQGILAVEAQLFRSKPVLGKQDVSVQWYYEILKACPNLEEVEVPLPHFPDSRGSHSFLLDDFLNLAGHLDHLRRVFTASNYLKILTLRGPEDRSVKLADLDAILRLRAFSTVSILKLSNPFWVGVGLDTTRTAKEIVENVDADSGIEEDLGDWPRIESLQSDDSTTIPRIFAFVSSRSPSLQHLSLANTDLQGSTKNECSPVLDKFGSSDPRFPHVHISSLTGLASSASSLKSISLYNVRLYQLFFNGSIVICSEDSLCQAFGKFTELKRVDLGILPTTDKNGYALLRSELEERGVKVSWKYCRSSRWCENCEKEHD